MPLACASVCMPSESAWEAYTLVMAGRLTGLLGRAGPCAGLAVLLRGPCASSIPKLLKQENHYTLGPLIAPLDPNFLNKRMITPLDHCQASLDLTLPRLPPKAPLALLARCPASTYIQVGLCVHTRTHTQRRKCAHTHTHMHT